MLTCFLGSLIKRETTSAWPSLRQTKRLVVSENLSEVADLACPSLDEGAVCYRSTSVMQGEGCIEAELYLDSKVNGCRQCPKLKYRSRCCTMCVTLYQYCRSDLPLGVMIHECTYGNCYCPEIEATFTRNGGEGSLQPSEHQKSKRAWSMPSITDSSQVLISPCCWIWCRNQGVIK